MDYITNIMAKHVDEHVDFVCMDGACAGAVKLLMTRCPWLSGVVCTTHSLDLLLEDIGKLEFVKNATSSVKRVVQYIRSHHATLALWRSISSCELKAPGDTRFGTHFIMLERVLRCRADLVRLGRSQEFADYIAALPADKRSEAK